jgi:hypothetical protein
MKRNSFAITQGSLVANTPASYSEGTGFKSRLEDLLPWLMFTSFSLAPSNILRDNISNLD